MKKEMFDVRSEFRKQVVTGITAAFAFLIALTWREPIEQAVNQFTSSLGLTKGTILSQLLIAVTVTIIAAWALVVLSAWSAQK